MLEQPMLFLKRTELKTLSVFIADADKYSGNVLLPASVIFMIPIFPAISAFQRAFGQWADLGLSLLQGKIKRAFTKALMYGIITSMKGEIYKVISCGNVI